MDNKTKSVSFWYQLFETNKNFIVRSTWICLLVFGYSFLFGLIVPASGEAWAYNLTIISGVLTAGFVGLIALAGMGIAAFFVSLMFSWGYRNAVKEIGRKEQPQYALPSGMGSDILYIEDTTVNKETNIERIEHYLKNLSDGCYFGLLSFRNPLATFQDSKGQSWAFNRADLEKQESVFDYSKESVNEFLEYAKYFKTHFAAYCAERKINNGASPLGAAMAQIKAAIVIIALLFSPQLFAQKSAMVRGELGAKSEYVPKANDVVTYTFANGSLRRTANGTLSVVALITHNRPSTVDANDLGAFIGCDINGTALTPPAAVNKQPEKPNALFADAENKVKESLPDSVNAREIVNNADEEISGAIKSADDLFNRIASMKTFNTICNILMVLFLLLRFMSNAALNETRLNQFGHVKYGGKMLVVGSVLGAFAFFAAMFIFGPVLGRFFYLFLDGQISKAFSSILTWQILGFIILCYLSEIAEWFLDRLLKTAKTDNVRGGRDYPQEMNQRFLK